MKAHHRTKQFTINIKEGPHVGDRIKVKAYQRTYAANPAGFYVDVNGVRYFFNLLDIDKAMEKAYFKFIKDYR